eukprot:Ihof_evm2s845 gene=Ihof_evmTU2s845
MAGPNYVWQYTIPLLRLDLFLGGFLCGGTFVIFFLLYFLWKAVYSISSASSPEEIARGEVRIPTILGEFYSQCEDEVTKQKPIKRTKSKTTDEEEVAHTISVPESETCIWFNLVLSHLFYAVRDTEHMRQLWKYYMMNELDELKDDAMILETITVREYDLGSSVPYVSNVSIVESLLHPKYGLTLVGDVEYTGGIHVTLDMALPLRTVASISLTLRSVRGKVRFQIHPPSPDGKKEMEREGCYSFAFCKEPEIDIKVESLLKGKSFENINTLLVSHLKRVFTMKHVLPSFKKRLIISDEKLREMTPRESKASIEPLTRLSQTMKVPIVIRNLPIASGLLRIR